MRRQLATVLLLMIVGACVATVASYPERRDDDTIRLRVDNRYSGAGIVVVRVMCEGTRIRAVRDVPMGSTRTVRLRNASHCTSGLYVDLTDVSGQRLHWRSQRVPVRAGEGLWLVMGATLNLSHLTPTR